MSASDAPATWVKAIRDLGSVGALIAMCGFLVYRLAAGVPSQQDIADVKSSLSLHVNGTTAEMTQMRALLRNICYNTATTDNQRAACGANP